MPIELMNSPLSERELKGLEERDRLMRMVIQEKMFVDSLITPSMKHPCQNQ